MSSPETAVEAALAAWQQRLTDALDNGEVFDSHLHYGRDRDGMEAPSDGLFGHLDASQTSGALVFALDDPNAGPRYSSANDRTLALARDDPRLMALARLDLTDEPLAEARRTLKQGAAGFKLHPRAQGFSFRSQAAADILNLCASARVPLVIHAGKGLGPFAEDLARLLDKQPDARVILAHAALADLKASARHLLVFPWVFFDTAVWWPADLAACLSLVGAGRVVYGSDWPYGQQPASLMLTLEVIEGLALGADARERILSSNARAILREDHPPAAATPPLSLQRATCPHAERLAHYVSMAFSFYWADKDARFAGILDLAVHVAGEYRDAPLLHATLVAAQSVWVKLPQLSKEEHRRADRLLSVLLHLCLVAVWTESKPYTNTTC